MVKRESIVSETHPALAGHFPGHPIVPGVMILHEVMESVRQLIGKPLRFVGIPAAKFVSPLRPGESLVIALDEHSEGHTTFLCTVGSRIVASGSLRHEIDSAHTAS